MREREMDEKQLQKIFTNGEENARKIPKIIFIVRIVVCLLLLHKDTNAHAIAGGLRRVLEKKQNSTRDCVRVFESATSKIQIHGETHVAK